MSSGGLQLTTGTSLPSGVRYEIHPLPIPTNQRLPWLSKAPPSRNLPCGVSLISANFSIGPTPCGKGGRPQGWTGPALGACAWALGTSPSGAMAQKRAIAPIDKEWSRRRRLGIASLPVLSDGVAGRPDLARPVPGSRDIGAVYCSGSRRADPALPYQPRFPPLPGQGVAPLVSIGQGIWAASLPCDRPVTARMTVGASPGIRRGRADT